MLNVRILTILSFIAMIFVLIGSVSATDIDTNDTVIVSASDDEIISVENDMDELDDDEIIGVENDEDELGLTTSTYSHLRDEIGSGKKSVDLSADYYSYDTGSTIIIDTDNCVINGNGAVIDMAGSDIRAFSVSASGVTFKNLTIQNVNFDSGSGGAIFFYNSGTVTDCTFQNNKATSSSGSALYFRDSGTVTNCNFVRNSANEYGGAVFFNGLGTVTDCKFTSNTAKNAGAVYFSSSGTVTNCNFVQNTANIGSAVYFSGSGNVTNCKFEKNTAKDYRGAVYFSSSGTVTDCNFTNNGGSAVYFNDNSISGIVKNCKFEKNTANNGGAVYFSGSGTVTNCNFDYNTANENGGAVCFSSFALSSSGTVTNCNFVNNSAINGGAVYFLGTTGNVTNCDFTGNNATNGSAIYFFKSNSANTLTISNSILLNNRADADALEVSKNDNNITITFTGGNNLLNAIYSIEEAEVSLTNVTYWGAEGKTNTGSSTVKPSRSNRAAGQNMTVGVVVNEETVLNKVEVTDENGTIVLNINVGENYLITVRHDTDSYYTEARKTISNTSYTVNVTSQTTSNKTVNITAKSNIPNEIIEGKLLFILPNSKEISANYIAGGTWWAVCEFDDYDVYEVNATYIGLNNVTINNATITINKANSTVDISDIVLEYGETKNVTVTTEGATGITAKIDGKDVDVVNNYTIVISGLDAGKYTLTVTTIADADHNNITKNVTITVNKIKTELTASAITTTYNINKDLVITLKDGNGTPLTNFNITVNLNGAKTYTTDKNGQVKVATKGLAAKTYTAKITFNGDSKYDKSTKDVKVTVKKAKTKITAKKKSFKKSKKVKKYTITLKDNTGKAIKKAKVTLKVKGKTYKAKTNSKGKATFKIKKLNKQGKFKAVIKYKGNKNYKKVSKKSKIKVIVTFKTISKGSKNKATVKKIQQALKNKGYYTTYKGSYLKVDGTYGDLLVRSVKEFQHDKGLKATGKVDEKTAQKLGII